ncbi:MAG: response regulator [Fluviicola sp.]
MNKLKIIIADDHKIFTNSLKLLLESNQRIEVVKEVFDGKELLITLEETIVDIVLLDINMPLMNGIEILSHFKTKNYKSPKFIVISMFTDKAIQKKIELLGAMAFLPKNLGKEELMDTIFDVYNSEKPIMNSKIDDYELITDPFNFLTRKEKEILNEISNGLNNQAIADKLFCSLFTIQTHRRNIHSKLGIKGHSALLNYIHKHKHLI